MLNLDVISKKVEDRISKDVLMVLKSGDYRFDVHVHLINKDYFSKKYLSIRMPGLIDLDFLMSIDNLMDYFKEEQDSKLINYAKFLHFISSNSLKDIAQNLINTHPVNTIFCPLMLDFEMNIDGKKKYDFFKQMDDHLKITKDFPGHFLPFVAIDPNNPMHTEIFNKAFSKEYNFFGIKIYPSLGFMPSHPNLMKIFEICEKYDIPVISHSGSDGVYNPKSPLTFEYFKLDDSGRLKRVIQKKNFFFRKQYSKLLGDPKLWEPVLSAFPKLRLNIAHFGGYREWDDNPHHDKGNLYTIIDLMERYTNVYSDISYIISQPSMITKFIELFESNEVVANKTLYGSDFHFIKIEGDFSKIRSKFQAELGSKIMNKISVENPLKFLNLVNFAKK